MKCVQVRLGFLCFGFIYYCYIYYFMIVVFGCVFLASRTWHAVHSAHVSLCSLPRLALMMLVLTGLDTLYCLSSFGLRDAAVSPVTIELRLCRSSHMPQARHSQAVLRPKWPLRHSFCTPSLILHACITPQWHLRHVFVAARSRFPHTCGASVAPPSLLFLTPSYVRNVSVTPPLRLPRTIVTPPSLFCHPLSCLPNVTVTIPSCLRFVSHTSVEPLMSSSCVCRAFVTSASRLNPASSRHHTVLVVPHSCLDHTSASHQSCLPDASFTLILCFFYDCVTSPSRIRPPYATSHLIFPVTPLSRFSVACLTSFLTLRHACTAG